LLFFCEDDNIKTMGWIYVMEDAALPDGSMAPVYPLGVNVLVARVDKNLCAVSGSCAHMACPLFMGRLDGYILTCPCHDWQFDIRTGQFLDAPELKLSIYPVKSEAGKLYIDIG
jgi:nitrite reductase/ring-hydroxylating ferredoxin subunit